MRVLPSKNIQEKNEGETILKDMQDPNIFFKTFDTKFALTSLYLWLLFGFLSTMVSCDIQSWMRDSTIFRHFIGIISFFLLFTVTDTNNKTHVAVLWAKTICIYIIFLLMMKSKWYFSLPILLILVLDQSIKTHCEYLEKRNDTTSAQEWEIFRNKLNIAILVLVGIGFIHYGVRQYVEYKSIFSFTKLLFSYNCKNK